MEKQKEAKNNARLKLVIVLIFLAVIITVLSFFVEKPQQFLDEVEIPARLTVVDDVGRMGFNLTNDTLDFGKIGVGSSGSKNITLSNNYDFPIVAKLSAEGNISEFLIYDASIRLESKEKRSYPIVTSVFIEGTDGIFTGKLRIKFVKA